MSTTAVVRVLVEIRTSGSTWGEECSVSQVRKQMIDNAVQAIERINEKAGGVNVRAVGPMQVLLVPIALTPDEEGKLRRAAT